MLAELTGMQWSWAYFIAGDPSDGGADMSICKRSVWISCVRARLSDDGNNDKHLPDEEEEWGSVPSSLQQGLYSKCLPLVCTVAPVQWWARAWHESCIVAWAIPSRTSTVIHQHPWMDDHFTQFNNEHGGSTTLSCAERVSEIHDEVQRPLKHPPYPWNPVLLWPLLRSHLVRLEEGM